MSLSRVRLLVIPWTAAYQAAPSMGFARQEFSSVQFSELLSRVRLCDPMNHNMLGLPVHNQLLEFTQTHVHQVSDAIQPSHPTLPQTCDYTLFMSMLLFTFEISQIILWNSKHQQSSSESSAV